jgi:uncharacterized protein (TIGR02217 family)
MVVDDTAPVFPLCPTFGFVAEPNLLVKIVMREGGYERRQRVWAAPLSVYSTVPLGDQTQADIEQVYYFWQAIGGMSNPFRFKDWLDYKSCRLDASPAATDQPLEPSGDSPASYRLVKEYVAGPFTQLRYIQRPIGSSIMIANGSGATQASSTWTVDETTGLVTPGVGFSGVPTAWGGEFDVWVRFNAQLNPSFSNHQVLNVSIQLKELRQPLA